MCMYKTMQNPQFNPACGPEINGSKKFNSPTFQNQISIVTSFYHALGDCIASILPKCYLHGKTTAFSRIYYNMIWISTAFNTTKFTFISVSFSIRSTNRWMDDELCEWTDAPSETFYRNKMYFFAGRTLFFGQFYKTNPEILA